MQCLKLECRPHRAVMKTVQRDVHEVTLYLATLYLALKFILGHF